MPSLKRVCPVIVPPALGSAAPAVVVVLVSTASRAAMSIPSTVPPTAILPETVKAVNVPTLVIAD